MPVLRACVIFICVLSGTEGYFQYLEYPETRINQLTVDDRPSVEVLKEKFENYKQYTSEDGEFVENLIQQYQDMHSMAVFELCKDASQKPATLNRKAKTEAT